MLSLAIAPYGGLDHGNAPPRIRGHRSIYACRKLLEGFKMIELALSDKDVLYFGVMIILFSLIWLAAALGYK